MTDPWQFLNPLLQLISSHLLQLLLSLQYHRTSIQITTALVSFQYFVQEVGFQVFLADVSKSIPNDWTGLQQNPSVKHKDQASPYWIRKLNYENLLSCWTAKVQSTIGGLVYTGIPKTSDDGYGSMGQPLFPLSGIMDNQTMRAQTRIVCKLLCGQGNGNGMIEHVVTVILTFVKSMVSKTSVMNIYTYWWFETGFKPRGYSTTVYTGRLRPRFSRKRYPFRIPSIDKWYLFHICLELCIPFNCCKCTIY